MSAKGQQAMMAEEQVALLRQSAAELVGEDMEEPCWGLAHRLSEMAEQIVAAEVAAGGCPLRFASSVSEGGSMFYGGDDAPVCGACGRVALAADSAEDKHEFWCVHRLEEPEPVIDLEVWGDAL